MKKINNSYQNKRNQLPWRRGWTGRLGDSMVAPETWLQNHQSPCISPPIHGSSFSVQSCPFPECVCVSSS